MLSRTVILPRTPQLLSNFLHQSIKQFWNKRQRNNCTEERPEIENRNVGENECFCRNENSESDSEEDFTCVIPVRILNLINRLAASQSMKGSIWFLNSAFSRYR